MLLLVFLLLYPQINIYSQVLSSNERELKTSINDMVINNLLFSGLFDFNIHSRNNCFLSTPSGFQLDSLIFEDTDSYKNKIEFKYDQPINIDSIIFLTDFNGNWMPSFALINTYQGSYLNNTTLKSWTGDEFINIAQDHYYYNDNGNQIVIKSDVWDNSVWENNLLSTSHFNSNGAKVLETNFIWIDDEWQKTSKTTIENNSDNLPVSNIFQIWENDSWQNFLFQYFYYNELNQRDSVITDSWTGFSWQHISKISIERTPYQFINLIFLWDVDHWEKDTRIVYDLSDQEDIIFAKCEYNNDGVWEATNSQIVIPNSNGYVLYLLTHRIQAYYAKPTDIDDSPSNIVSDYKLYQNYPNPFNPSTVIEYSIPKAADVNLVIYNLLGQKVATLVNTQQAQGAYEVKFDASRLTSGIYFYTLTAGDFVQTKKMMLLK